MDSKPASTQPENPLSENSPVLEKDSRTTAVYHTVYYPMDSTNRVAPGTASRPDESRGAGGSGLTALSCPWRQLRSRSCRRVGSFQLA